MTIESRHWREDLTFFARQFRPLTRPPRWSERLAVNFEKDVTLSLFMVRKLDESGKFSSRFRKHRAAIFRSPSTKPINRMNYLNIDDVYDLDQEEAVSKPASFVCNQFIHGGATFAYRGKDRNWEGLYTCSDYEMRRHIYRVPLVEIVKILELASTDYPSKISMVYSHGEQDYNVTVE